MQYGFVCCFVIAYQQCVGVLLLYLHMMMFPMIESGLKRELECCVTSISVAREE